MDNQSKADWMEKTKSHPIVEWTRNVFETAFVVTFIFTGVASTLIHFDRLVVSTGFQQVIGAITSAFTIVVFLAFIDRGVKFNTKSKKRK